MFTSGLGDNYDSRMQSTWWFKKKNGFFAYRTRGVDCPSGMNKRIIDRVYVVIVRKYVGEQPYISRHNYVYTASTITSTTLALYVPLSLGNVTRECVSEQGLSRAYKTFLTKGPNNKMLMSSDTER
jgi:hypothetical protein